MNVGKSLNSVLTNFISFCSKKIAKWANRHFSIWCNETKMSNLFNQNVLRFHSLICFANKIQLCMSGVYSLWFINKSRHFQAPFGIIPYPCLERFAFFYVAFCLQTLPNVSYKYSCDIVSTVKRHKWSIFSGTMPFSLIIAHGRVPLGEWCPYHLGSHLD